MNDLIYFDSCSSYDPTLIHLLSQIIPVYGNLFYELSIAHLITLVYLSKSPLSTSS